MKNLQEYINESLESIKRFKIDDLAQELELNNVSKTRRKEIKKFFETILGPAPYYCISHNNEDAKNDLSVTREDYSIKLKNIVSNVDEIEDEKWRNAFIEYNKRAKRHNEMVENMTDELKSKIEKLQNEVIGVTMSGGRFKFGYKGVPVELFGAICEYNNTVMPCIMQIGSQSDGRIKSGEQTETYYLSCKDID